MKTAFHLTILILVLTLSSCMYRNYTLEKKGRCAVHDRKLKKRLVRLVYGYPFDFWCSSYPYAKKTISLGCERPKHGPPIRLAKAYTCKECTVACRHAMKK